MKNKTLKDYLHQMMTANRKLIIGLILVIAGSTIASLIPPLVLEKVVNQLTTHEVIPFMLALSYFLFIVLADVLESLQNAVITIFGQKMTHSIRSALCAKLSRLPAQYFHTHQSGEIESIFTNDGDAIDVLYSDGVVSMIADCFKLIAILIVIFTRSYGLGLLLVAVTPFLYLFTRWSQKRMKKAQLDNRRAIARVNGHVPETLRCIRMIHGFHAEKHMEDTYDGYIKESYDAVDRANIVDSVYSPVILITQAAVTAVMMILAARGSAFRSAFGLSVGSAVAMIAYIGKIFSPLENIGMEIQNIQAASAAVRHIETFLDEPEWQPEHTEPEHSSALVFSHVTFGYEKDRTVLHDLSFRIEEGEHVTFAGRTGAGKSTIFRLLTGLYEPDQGLISLAGHCPTDLAAAEKRKIYGYVEQSFHAVPGTIRDQITLYDPACTDQDIAEALSLTGLDETIAQLPQQLDTPMDESLFSKGQLQLLAIARAIVFHPQILLLDEITASLDAETEARVVRALQASSEGRTVVSISHRLSESIQSTRIITIGA
jgi:ABC-type multidrug transport system fused ATPase/permease subunit